MFRTGKRNSSLIYRYTYKVRQPKLRQLRQADRLERPLIQECVPMESTDVSNSARPYGKDGGRGFGLVSVID